MSDDRILIMIDQICSLELSPLLALLAKIFKARASYEVKFLLMHRLCRSIRHILFD